MSKRPKEGRRCWTLHYADGTQFHMDVLPALPDAQTYRTFLEKKGHRDLASDLLLTDQAIAITDNTHPQYAQRSDDWPLSNPAGYAAWFRNRMIVRLMEMKKILARSQRVTANVEDIPDYKVKTPLQRAIQILKRHRDCMFVDDYKHKPISIIITSLSAHAYNNETTVSEALQSILKTMDRYIEYRGEEAWIKNPVNPAENFADKWGEEPQKRKNFFLWLERAREDFALYLRANPFNKMPDVLKENLGVELVDRVLKSIVPVAVAAPAVARDASYSNNRGRAEAIIDDIRRTRTASKPWTKR